MSGQFAIKTSVFEGPLELLLHLIEKRKLFINDIALAEVADEYIEHVRTLEQFPTKDVAQFVLIASTLVLIKSKSLLPQLELTQEEQTDIQDLENRLRIYQHMQALSKHVTERFGKDMIFTPAESQQVEVTFAPHGSISIASLLEAVRRVMTHLPKKEVLKKAIVEKVMSLEDMLTTLTQRIQTNLRMSFKEFTRKNSLGTTPREAKINMIVGFLAMLELVKQGVLAVRQQAHFADIDMETQQAGIPQYE